MKRILLLAAILLSAAAVKAQSPLSFGTMNSASPVFSHFRQVDDSSAHHKKWFFTKYATLSSGFVAFRGGSGAFLSAPVGLQINRQLTNNVYAFAGVSVAPTYFNFNSSFYQPGVNKNNSFMNGNNLGIYSSVHMGLMYINDEKTFSISGNFSAGRLDGRSPSYMPATIPVFKNSRQ